MGTKLRAWVEPPWVREVLRTELEPGEVIEAMAEFKRVPKGGDPAQPEAFLAVLTNRYLRSFQFTRNVFSVGAPPKKPKPVASSYAIPLHQISSIGEKRIGSVLLVAARTMSFTCPTGAETWWTFFVEGARLVDALKAKLSGGAPKPIGVADELAKLAALKEEGILSGQEFERSKALFIGAPGDQQAEALDLLRQLHALQRAGVLSEMEFNMKKWDVLSRPAKHLAG